MNTDRIYIQTESWCLAFSTCMKIKTTLLCCCTLFWGNPVAVPYAWPWQLPFWAVLHKFSAPAREASDYLPPLHHQQPPRPCHCFLPWKLLATRDRRVRAAKRNQPWYQRATGSAAVNPLSPIWGLPPPRPASEVVPSGPPQAGSATRSPLSKVAGPLGGHQGGLSLAPCGSYAAARLLVSLAAGGGAVVRGRGARWAREEEFSELLVQATRRCPGATRASGKRRESPILKRKRQREHGCTGRHEQCSSPSRGGGGTDTETPMPPADPAWGWYHHLLPALSHLPPQPRGCLT